MKTLHGLVGAGGFGREAMPVAAEMLRAASKDGPPDLVFVVEGAHSANNINGYPVMSADQFLADPRPKEFNIAIGDDKVRERIATEFIERGAKPMMIRASNAVVFDGNEIGEGAVLCPFTMVTSNARIGRFFHANIYSYVAHDCVIGDFVTFAPGVKCNGAAVVEDHAYIGTGAIIKQGSKERPIVIGRGAIIGMGAVVTKSVPAGATVVGNPAAPLQRR